MRQGRVSKLSSWSYSLLLLPQPSLLTSHVLSLGRFFLWTSFSRPHQPPENKNYACFCRCGSKWFSCWLFALATTAASPSAAPLLCLQAAVSKAAAFSSHSKFFLATTKAKKKKKSFNETWDSAVTAAVLDICLIDMTWTHPGVYPNHGKREQSERQTR